MDSKALKMHQVGRAALMIVERHGLDGLNFTRVARSAKVSRPWLYKYIGKTNQSLIDFSVNQFGRKLANMDNRKNPTTPQEWMNGIIQGVDQLLVDSAEAPWMIHLYFRYRGTPTLFGERIGAIEAEYLKITANEMKRALQISERKAVFIASTLIGVRMGLAHQWITSFKQQAWERNQVLKFMAAIVERSI